jgi:Holliday junction resolvase
MNGSEYERRLAKHLHSEGYAVMRAPSSGSATKRELPDLFYSKVSEPARAVELKSTAENVAYFQANEVFALQEFANSFGAKPRLVVRIKNDRTYYVFRPDDARMTKSGNYALDRDIQPTITINP